MEDNHKEPVRTILTRGIVARLDVVAAQKTLSRSALIRMGCEKLLQEEKSTQNEMAAA